MNHRLVILAMFVLAFVACASHSAGEGTVLLLGPGDRGEGAVPPGGGEFTVDIFAEDMPGFAGLTAITEFLIGGTPASGFLVALGGPATPFSDRKIVHNTVYFPGIMHACIGREIVGFVSMEEEFGPPPDYEYLGYVDKTLPPLEDNTAVNPPELGETGWTWLMSVTYEYDAAVANGAYTISFDGTTTFADSTLASIPYTIITGSVAIGTDTTPPTPDPMTWAIEPFAATPTSVTMTATTATDVSGVEYYFEELSGSPGGSSSGWHDSTTYTDTGLQPAATYTYRVKARDKSPAQNETGYSASLGATPPDTTPPSPDPMTWAVEPYSASSTSVSMTAATASDPSGAEYYFEETSGNPGATDSGWQGSPTYTDTGLTRGAIYIYKVKARDKSPSRNETAFSVSRASRGLPGDTNHDCRVNIVDIIYVRNRLATNCSSLP